MQKKKKKMQKSTQHDWWYERRETDYKLQWKHIKWPLENKAF